MQIYILLLLLLIGSGSIAAYLYYLREKGDELDTIAKGICPYCGKKSIELYDIRGGGCGPRIVSYRCTLCDYDNSFSIDGDCNI
jgi:hypothetical protein